MMMRLSQWLQNNKIRRFRAIMFHLLYTAHSFVSVASDDCRKSSKNLIFKRSTDDWCNGKKNEGCIFPHFWNTSKTSQSASEKETCDRLSCIRDWRTARSIARYVLVLHRGRKQPYQNNSCKTELSLLNRSSGKSDHLSPRFQNPPMNFSCVKREGLTAWQQCVD